jgi:glycosyltransferase involved in cell wall biosynthesis
MKSHLDLSIVVPVYNEEENIAPLYTEITDALANLGLSYEIIVVNDGSQDGTMARLRAVQERDRRVVVIDFRRNFGQTAALSAGFDHSNGEVIITLDGDLQNDPRDIPLLLDKIKDYDIVNGWRKNRQDKALSRKLPSKIANKLISWVTGVKLNDYGCTLKAYRKDVIKTIKLYGEMHRFIPAIASAMGITYCEVPTHHRARRFGKTKYGISRTIRVILDLMTVKFLLSYNTRPIQLFGAIGIMSGFTGFIICLYMTFLKLAGQSIGSRPLLLLGVLMIILSAFFIVLGLLGEVLIRLYYEVQGKPVYYIKEVHRSEI